VISATDHMAPINPVLTTSSMSARIADIVFDGLVRLNEQFEPEPHLAESWGGSADGREWTFHLKKGVRFHDGVELTAEDVAFSFQKYKQYSSGSAFSYLFGEVHSVEAADRYTVRIKTKIPLASFVQGLHMAILPKHLFGGSRLTIENFGRHPIGTGPYKVTEWSETKVELEANENYFLGKPAIGRIRVEVNPSREAVWAKLMAGEVDYFDYLTPDNFETLKSVPSFEVYSAPIPFYYMIVLNLKEEKFGDSRVRRALNYAVDKDEIVKRALKGRGSVSSGMIFPGSWAYDPAVKPYPYDPRKALALLREAGWEDRDGDHFLDRDGRPFEFAIYVDTGDDLKKRAAVIIQQQLLDVGIKTKFIFFDPADLGVFFRGQFDAAFVQIVAMGDPDTNYGFWHSSQIHGGFNLAGYSNQGVDRLLEAGRTTFERDRRKGIYSDFQKAILNDPPGIFLFWNNFLAGVNTRLRGVTIGPVSSFRDIWKWHFSEGEGPERDENATAGGRAGE
jgi:peptide/nickel transport system substrate-binding protein